MFENGTMLVDNRKYVHSINQETGRNVLVNSCFISGNYQLNNNEVTFNNDGTISGLNNLIKYQLVLNYNDMGMDDDLIYFRNTDGESVEYIYDFKNDTLKLFEISCKSYEGKHCAEIERGNIVYQLSKNKD